jgi:hypothetical protein
MAWKAHSFKDKNTLRKILEPNDPQAINALIKTIAKFDATKWTEVEERILKDGIYAKLTDCETYKKILLTTGDRELIEASRTYAVDSSGAKAAAQAKVDG